jgi:hypothetical protein
VKGRKYSQTNQTTDDIHLLPFCIKNLPPLARGSLLDIFPLRLLNSDKITTEWGERLGSAEEILK